MCNVKEPIISLATIFSLTQINIIRCIINTDWPHYFITKAITEAKGGVASSIQNKLRLNQIEYLIQYNIGMQKMSFVCIEDYLKPLTRTGLQLESIALPLALVLK